MNSTNQIKANTSMLNEDHVHHQQVNQ
uniref:Uncharacterized protein n=1 Tax=Rhizophora mucronata TaxID=61149 RepID=A0A2P2PWV5_RHIMU